MMYSPFANIFIAIQARLQALTAGIGSEAISITFQVGTKNPLIRFIDQDIDQIMWHERPAVDYPFVLIDFQNFDFENFAENDQIGTGDVVITLGLASYNNTSDVTPQPYKEMGLKYYDIEWMLNKALHGWTPTINGNAIQGIGALTRKHATKDGRRPDMRLRRIVYKVAFEDYSTETEQEYVNAAINVGYEDDGAITT